MVLWWVISALVATKTLNGSSSAPTSLIRYGHPNKPIRTGWAIVTPKGCACEKNRDNVHISRASFARGVATADECQRLCEAKPNCAAVDYLDGTKWCNFFNTACQYPAVCTSPEGGSWTAYKRIGRGAATHTALQGKESQQQQQQGSQTSRKDLLLLRSG